MTVFDTEQMDKMRENLKKKTSKVVKKKLTKFQLLYQSNVTGMVFNGHAELPWASLEKIQKIEDDNVCRLWSKHEVIN